MKILNSRVQKNDNILILWWKFYCWKWSTPFNKQNVCHGKKNGTVKRKTDGNISNNYDFWQTTVHIFLITQIHDIYDVFVPVDKQKKLKYWLFYMDIFIFVYLVGAWYPDDAARPARKGKCFRSSLSSILSSMMSFITGVQRDIW